MATLHHAGDFCRHIFSESPYPKVINETCNLSGRWGFTVLQRVKYVTMAEFKIKGYYYNQQKMVNVYVDLRIAYMYINRANVYHSNQIFLKKFGRP